MAFGAFRVGQVILMIQLFIGSAALGMPCRQLIAYRPVGPSISRVNMADFYPPSAIARPQDKGVFFDPADTLTFALATLDITEPDSRVLELGSGMGLASWLIGNRAARVHGVELHPPSVAYANTEYANETVSFSNYDYLSNGPLDLALAWPEPAHPPTVMAANPPYVPCDSKAKCLQLPDGAWASMYGGPHGTRYHYEIIHYADRLNIQRLALCLGSYSTPGAVFSHLESFGYRVTSLTLTAVLNGEFSNLNSNRIHKLKQSGHAFTWRNREGREGYLIVGLSAIRSHLLKPGAATLSKGQFIQALTLGGASQTTDLELINERNLGQIPIRIVR